MTGLDTLLHPVLRNHHGDNPTNLAYALLTKGLASRKRPDQVRRWAATHGGIDVHTITQDPQTWAGMVARTRTHLRKPDTQATRYARAVQAAHATLHHTLTPTPTPRDGTTPSPTPTTWNGVRHLLLLIGHHTLTALHTHGYDNTLANESDLAVPLGVTRQSVARRLNLVGGGGVGWVVVAAKHSTTKKMRMHPRKLTRGQVRVDRDGLRVIAADIGDVVFADPESMVETRRQAHPAAQVFLSVTHPAWGYDKRLSGKVLLVLLADSVGVDPVARFGMTSRAVTTARKTARDVLGWDPRAGVTPDLVAALNQAGAASGAFARLVQVEQRRDEARRTLLARREEYRAEKAREAAEAEAVARDRKEAQARVRKHLDMALRREAGVTPPVGASDTELAQWCARASQVIHRKGLPPGTADAAQVVLARRLTGKGWPTVGSRSMAAQILTRAGYPA